LFRLWLSEEIIQKIVGIPPPHPTIGVDKIIWRVELTRRGIGHDLACGVCDHSPEDALHAIRDCPVTARNIWDQLIPLDWYSRFYAGNIHEWLDSNLENQHDWCLGDVDWQCLFGITAWLQMDLSRNELRGIVRDRDGEWILGYNRFMGGHSYPSEFSRKVQFCLDQEDPSDVI
ncbi:hypothetical protein Goarm_009387, partial [Gossypium armourianum]|nr:hypothetical protein [Gossypium armourianum]